MVAVIITKYDLGRLRLAHSPRCARHTHSAPGASKRSPCAPTPAPNLPLTPSCTRLSQALRKMLCLRLEVPQVSGVDEVVERSVFTERARPG